RGGRVPGAGGLTPPRAQSGGSVELLLSILALLVAAAALALAWQARAGSRRAEGQAEAALREAARARSAVADARSLAEALRRELDELRAAANAGRPLPIPGAPRGRDLDELRQQLRAA